MVVDVNGILMAGFEVSATVVAEANIDFVTGELNIVCPKLVLEASAFASISLFQIPQLTLPPAIPCNPYPIAQLSIPPSIFVMPTLLEINIPLVVSWARGRGRVRVRVRVSFS